MSDADAASRAGAGRDPAPLRAAIVGAGFAARLHARAARLAGARLAGVTASSPARADRAREELGAERAFESAERLVASDEVDVVHVCTPNHLHLPLGRAALAAGKHLVCEKPIALDEAGALALVQAARAAGRVATVPFVYRYWPTVREARARVRSGELGELRLVLGGYLQDWLAAAEDSNWRVDSGLGGRSRAFADIGSHLCDLLEFVSGRRIARLAARTALAHPRRASASGHAFARAAEPGAARPVETEDVAALLVELDDGTVGTLAVSQVSLGRKNQLWLELAGAEATLRFDGELPETLWVGRRERAEAIPRDPAGLRPEAAAYATLPGGHPQGYGDLFDAFVSETYEAIRGAPPADGLPEVADGLRAVRLTEAVLEAAAGEAWVEPTS